MDSKLLEFVGLLRQNGVRVSFAEEPVTPDEDAWGPWTESWFYVAGGSGSEASAGEISLP